MAGKPFENGRYLADGGDVGGDEQVGPAPTRQFVQLQDDGLYLVITEYAYATRIENASDGYRYDVVNQTEILRCRDTADIGGTEVNSETEYEHPSAFAFRTLRDATRYARRYIRGLNIEHYGWDEVRVCKSTWLLFDSPEDEEASHEANIFELADGFSAEWCHTAVGQVSTREFPTYEAAAKWLEDGGYQDFTA